MGAQGAKPPKTRFPARADSTSLASAGRPINFTRWRIYNHAVRPWYTVAKEGWAAGRKTVFSPVWARPGRLSALSVLHSRLVLYGALCMGRRALNNA